MARVADGDECAFEELVSRYSASVSRYLRAMVKDPERASDLTQDTFLKLWLKANRFRPSGPFRAWLYRMARNTALSDMRKAKVREMLNLAWPTRQDQELEPSSTAPGPEQAALHGELADLLRGELERLPAHQREAFVLADVEGFTMAELARVSGSPEGTVKARLHRARRTLRDRLDARLGGTAPLARTLGPVGQTVRRAEEM